MNRLILLLVFISLPFSFSAVAAEELRVGAAQVDITPKHGTPMAGYYRFRAVEGVLDPIFAKSIVIEQEGSHVVLVAIDLSGTTRPIVAAARKAIAEQCGIDGSRVLISGTHTHTGPQLARGSMMDDITQANSPPGMAYMQALPEWIAQSVKEAKARLAPASASAVIGKAEGISFNRRVLREGVQEAIWQPRSIDPSKEKPAGPVDPDVGILLFQSGGTPVASYLNFAMHPTSVGGGQKISADYPGVFTRLVAERHGPGMVCLFANGCCGDINHTDYITGKRRTTEELGTALADAATAAWPDLKELTTFKPRVKSEQVTLQRRSFDEAAIAMAKDIASRMMTEKLGTVPMAEAVCILETVAKKEVPLVAEVQVMAFSEELAVVSLPGEIFVELGLSLKKQSPFKHTFIAELANGSIGYIPHRDAYPQGNYEVVSSRCEPGSGEKLVETALKLLAAVKAGE